MLSVAAGPDLDAVVFYERPMLKFDRILTTALRAWPKGRSAFNHAMKNSLGEKVWVRGIIQAQAAQRLIQLLGVDERHDLKLQQNVAIFHADAGIGHAGGEAAVRARFHRVRPPRRRLKTAQAPPPYGETFISIN